MLAVSLQQGEVLVVDAGVPERPPQFALLQMMLAGICNTDLELQRGYYGFQGIPGHEFVARVVESDNAKLIGKRVVGEINIACGACDMCSEGLARHCRNRSVLGILKHPGAFAEYFILPDKNLHVLPDSVPDRDAVFCEPLAAACEILDQVSLEAKSKVAVLGDGKLGLLITQVLLASDFEVTLYGRHETKLALARRAGADAFLAQDLPVAEYRCVVECTGSADGLAAAISMTRPRGSVILKSTIHRSVPIDMAPVIVNEISLIGSRCGRFGPALALLEQGRVCLTSMISAELPIRDAKHAFALATTRGALKILLHP